MNRYEQINYKINNALIRASVRKRYKSIRRSNYAVQEALVLTRVAVKGRPFVEGLAIGIYIL